MLLPIQRDFWCLTLHVQDLQRHQDSRVSHSVASEMLGLSCNFSGTPSFGHSVSSLSGFTTSLKKDELRITDLESLLAVTIDLFFSTTSYGRGSYGGNLLHLQSFLKSTVYHPFLNS